MNPDRCAQPTPSGLACQHLAGRCPFHPAPGTAPAIPPEEPPEPHRYVWDSLNSAIAGRLSPASLRSLVSAFALAERLGPPPADRDRMYDEISLKGNVMHGMPPLTERQWLLARGLFTPGALHMMAHWLKSYDPPPPDWLQDIPNPEEDLFPPVSRETFRDHSFDYQPLPEYASSFDPEEPELQL